MLFGKTPTSTQVRGLVEWLDGHDDPLRIFATHALSAVYPPAADFVEAACGLLATRLMRSRQEFVLWFRPELIQTVH
ncbi:MAG TPA: hypothetical protein VFD73_09210, partial [Gemmatimonadales bacterium]|nr:hypothetical protein [Gemmatimonadales bacterium]